VAHTNPEK